MTSKKSSQAVGIILLFIIILGDILSGALASRAPTSTGTISNPLELGTWYNIPDSNTCPVDVTPGDLASDSCELLGNSTYRQVLEITPGATNNRVTYQLMLSVSCTVGSNTAGALLQLQYANFTTGADTNITKFVNTGSFVYIDGGLSFNAACPKTSGLIGPMTVSSFLPFSLPLLTEAFIFRVIEQGGGGTGDNPRINSVSLLVQAIPINLVVNNVQSITTTGFTLKEQTTSSVAVLTSITSNWIATNETQTIHLVTIGGSNGCSITAGTTSCTVAVSFGFTFKTTPRVVATPTISSTGANPQPYAVITLFTTEAVTVQS